MRKTAPVTLLSLVCVALLGAAGPGRASEADADLKALRARMSEIDAQQRQLSEQLEKVERQRQELELLMNRVSGLQNYRGGADPAKSGDQPTVVGSEQKKEKDAQAEAVPELPRVSDDIGGVLTPRGRLVLEPSAEYIHGSASRVSIEGFTIIPALLIGIIDIIEANHDTLIGSLATRYGVTNNFEVEVRVPYVYRSDTTVTREFLKPSDAPSIVDATGHDIGDVELGLRYQLPRPSPTWPYMVANLQVKSNTGTDPFELATEATLTGEPKSFNKLPTGTGFWSLNPSLTFIYPSDPVVFFGNVGYLINIIGNKGHLFGEVDPGDAIRLNAGMGIALNDRSSFSLSYQLDLYDSTYIESNKIVGSDVTVGRLLIGYSLKMPGGTPLNLAIAIGATKDAPDSDVTFRVPFNFDLFR